MVAADLAYEHKDKSPHTHGKLSLRVKVAFALFGVNCSGLVAHHNSVFQHLLN